MKKILFLMGVLLTILTAPALSQTPDFIRTKKIGDQNVSDARLKAYLSFSLPHFPTFTLNGAKDSIGYAMYNTTTNNFGVYTGSGVWKTYTTISEVSAAVAAAIAAAPIPNLKQVTNVQNSTDLSLFIGNSKGDDPFVGSRIQLNDGAAEYGTTNYRSAALHLGDDGDALIQTYRSVDGLTGSWSTRARFKNADGAFNIVSTPTTATSDYSMLVRDNTTGDVKQVASGGGGGGSFLPLSGGTLTGDLIRYNGFGNPDVAILSPNILDISNSTTSRISRTYANKMQYVQGGSLTLDLTPATLTANRTITYPNASGTIALTAELSSYLPLSGGTLSGDLLISKTQPNLILSSTNPGPPGRAMSFYTTGTATNMMVDSTAVFSISGQSKANILAATGAGAIPYLTLRSYTSGGATLSTPLRIERPLTSADGYLKYTTANSIKWLVGGNAGSENYTIKNDALGTNALSVDIANNNISLTGHLTIASSPATSPGLYDVLTRNQTTGVVEKVSSSLVNPTLSTVTSAGNTTAQSITIGGLINTKGVLLEQSTYTADATLTTQLHTAFVNASSGAKTITLIDAQSNQGRIFVIKKTDNSANAVTVHCPNLDKIDGLTDHILSAQYDFIMIQSDGTNWNIISK